MLEYFEQRQHSLEKHQFKKNKRKYGFPRWRHHLFQGTNSHRLFIVTLVQFNSLNQHQSRNPFFLAAPSAMTQATTVTMLDPFLLYHKRTLPRSLFSQFFLHSYPNNDFFFFQCLQHMQVPRLGFKLQLQLQSYTTATAVPVLSCICNPRHSSHKCRILQPTEWAARNQICILMDTSLFYYPLATMGTAQ